MTASDNMMDCFQKEMIELAEKHGVGFLYSAFKLSHADVKIEDLEDNGNSPIIASGGDYLFDNSNPGEALLKCLKASFDCIFDYAIKSGYNMPIFYALVLEGAASMGAQIISENVEKQKMMSEIKEWFDLFNKPAD